MINKILKSDQTMRYIKDYLIIILGVFLLAYSVVAFFQPQNMVTGGVSGLGVIIADYSTRWLGWEIPIWLTNLVFNIPLFIIGAFTLKGESIVKSAFATLFFTLALFLVQFLPVPENDIVLATVFGGVVSGVGVGLVLRALATTGGTTLAGAIVHNSLVKHVSVAKIIFIIDSAIVVIGLVAFGPVATMYAISAIYVSTKVMEAVLEGMHFAKAAFVISEKSETIAEHVMSHLDRGVTELRGRGMYTKHDKNVLICVVSTKELIKLKQLVSDIDENAFVIVADVREVLGEGFKPHS
ncbi:MAG: YitT family protein [Defluviitaleaceae bacterium]|nr:YitT family protein [Defluviitaleaceae bacterium]